MYMLDPLYEAQLVAAVSCPLQMPRLKEFAPSVKSRKLQTLLAANVQATAANITKTPLPPVPFA